MSLPDVLNRCESILDVYGKYDEVKWEKAETSQCKTLMMASYTSTRTTFGKC